MIIYKKIIEFSVKKLLREYTSQIEYKECYLNYLS